MDNDANNNGNNDGRLAIAALVCGIVSIFIFPLAFGSAAIIFGVMVQGRTEKDSREYQYARLGIILGAVGLVFWVVSLAALNLIGFDANSLLGGAGGPQPAF